MEKIVQRNFLLSPDQLNGKHIVDAKFPPPIEQHPVQNIQQHLAIELMLTQLSDYCFREFWEQVSCSQFELTKLDFTPLDESKYFHNCLEFPIRLQLSHYIKFEKLCEFATAGIEAVI